jgi:hypothetical protein
MCHEWRKETYGVLVGKSEIKMSFTRTRRSWEDNIRIGLKEVESEARHG